jgi:hypothetical protein
MWAYNIINARSHIMFEETTVSHKDKKQDDCSRQHKNFTCEVRSQGSLDQEKMLR